MIKILFISISFISGFVLFAIVVSLVGLDEIMQGFARFSPFGLVPLIALTVISFAINTVRWRYILGAMGISIPFGALFKVGFVGYAVGYVMPVMYVGGDVFRGYILRDRYRIPWHKALSSIAIDKILEANIWIFGVFASSFLFLLQSGIPAFSKSIVGGLLTVVFFAGMITVVYVFSFQKTSIVRPLFLKPFGLEQSSGGKLITEIERDFHVFFSWKNRKCITGALGLSLVKYALLWLRNVLVIYYLVELFSPGGGIISLGFSYVSYLLPIPAALGAQEAFLSLAFVGMGMTAGDGAVFTLLLRGAEALLVGAGVVFLLHWGLGKFALNALKRLRADRAQQQ